MLSAPGTASAPGRPGVRRIFRSLLALDRRDHLKEGNQWLGVHAVVHQQAHLPEDQTGLGSAQVVPRDGRNRPVPGTARTHASDS